jgi:peptide-methionine (S)-S-oxide reductase
MTPKPCWWKAMAAEPPAFCPLPGQGLQVAPSAVPLPAQPLPNDPGVLVLGGGCFWCTEAVFAALDGVESVLPGYAGGHAARANYEAVCTGSTGHAEVIRLGYTPSRISAGELLRVFLSVAHDPTQKDRQGNDVGTQYRSVVFAPDAAFAAWVRAYLAQLDGAGVFAAPLATTVEPLQGFFPAEAYHHRYAERNPAQPYIAAVSAPKLRKLQTFRPDLLKR